MNWLRRPASSSAAAATAGSGYMPQLDTLRAVAVLSVLVHHFYPSEDLPGVLSALPWGQWGVQLFFVLSGFLITGILLRAKTDLSESEVSYFAVLRQFYIRRFLRILPIYYLVIGV